MRFLIEGIDASGRYLRHRQSGVPTASSQSWRVILRMTPIGPLRRRLPVRKHDSRSMHREIRGAIRPPHQV